MVANATGEALLREPIERQSFVALDLETTGVAPGHDRIIEMGAVRFGVDRTGKVCAGPVFERLVGQERPIPPPTVDLTGITDALVAEASPLAQVWTELEAFLASVDRTVIVAHNARADLAFLVTEASRLGRAWRGPPAICTLAIARRVLPARRGYRLEVLVRALELGSAEPRFHRAVPDAIHARNLLAHCVGVARARTLGDLRAASPVRVPAVGELMVTVPPELTAVGDAIAEHRAIRIVYRGGSKGRDARAVTPLSFYRFEGVIYLRAVCHLDGVPKSFRCDRIGRVTI